MKRNIRIASGIMFASLLGLLAFQAYWISSAYKQKKSTLESEIREAFSKANNGLLIKKLGDYSGVEIQVSAEGGFFTDSLFLNEDIIRGRINGEKAISRTLSIDARTKTVIKGHIVDTVMSELEGVLGQMGRQLEKTIFMSHGDINDADMGFMDSLLRFYLEPIDFENAYVLSFGKLGSHEYEFSEGPKALPVSGTKTKSLIQPLSFGVQDKMAKLEYAENRVVRATLSSMGLIILASLLMLGLLISAWYYIVRSLQRQYELTQMKDDFISNMTHELKTPVTASSLALEVLAKNEKVSGDQNLQGLIGVAKSEQDRMLTMIDSILESTTENGLGEEEMEVLDLAEELEAVTETIRFKVTEAGGKLSVRLPDKPLLVSGSQVHLQNAMINILENAVKYSPEEVEIDVALTQENQMALLQVSDKGMGIGKEDQKRIFEKFFRVSTGNVHTIKGYGLGLSYTRTVIEKLGGSIELDSETGKGSVFKIKLPLHHES